MSTRTEAPPLELDTTPPNGLSAAEAARRFHAGLGNTPQDGLSRSVWQILVANVFTLFNGIVFAGFGILLLLGRWQDALFGLPALFNTLIGVWQETNAKRTLDRLAVLNAPTATVVRDGQLHEVKPHEVVLGDLLSLRVGDQVTADAILVADANVGGEEATWEHWLDVDESLLTGESDAIRKEPGNEVLSGSTITRGHAFAEVIRVGADAYAAKITAEAKRFQLVRSELRQSIDRLLRWITWALGPMILIVAWGQLRAYGGWEDALQTGEWKEAVVGAVAVVIAMVPLGLVLVTSIAFAVGGVALAREQVLIQELPAVEGLARVDTLCLDKTGTLTSGEMRFDQLHVIRDLPGIEQVLGYIGADPDANGTARCLAEPFHPGDLRVTGQIPFDSARKWSAIEVGNDPGAADPGAGDSGVADPGAAAGLWVFGAPEFVMHGCTHDAAGDTLEQAGDRAEDGLRTLLLAHTPSTDGIDPEEPTLPDRLQPVALVTFREQVRDDAAPAMAYFAEQGVNIRIISGDDPRTVAAVAREVGLNVTTGYDARTLPSDPDELAAVMDEHLVYGRVTPDQKLGMVRALQSRGHVVAMTGDGVNDVLAIKEADLGIAMDSAAASTKAVARLVLLDGRFSRLPGVVAEGRRVIANIERVSKLFLTKTTYAFAVGLVFAVLAWSFPFLPRQLSITDGLTIGVPAFFLALMPNTARYREGFLRRSLLFSVPSGLIVAVALITLHIGAQQLQPGGYDTILMQSASTLTLAGIALWVLAVLARPFHWLRIAVVLSMYLGLAIVWTVPFLREFFQVTFLPEPLAWLVLTIVLIGMLLVEILKAWHTRVTAER